MDKADSDDQAAADYTLHVFPFSLYSIMARLTATLAYAYHKPTRPMRITLKLVDLHRDEELSEAYLLRVNPKGQVPAMTGASLPGYGYGGDGPPPGRPQRPQLTDSLDISYRLCEAHYPAMLPGAHREEIMRLLARLHAIQGMSLSVRDFAPHLAVEVPSPGLDALLARRDISEEYRRALEFKKEYYKRTLGPSLRPENIARATVQAGELFSDLLALYHRHQHHASPAPGKPASSDDGVPWLFGREVSPTVLDAHAAALIARLIDAKQEDLVPAELLSYARMIVALPAWAEVTHGRSTIWNVSYGHVALLEQI